MHIGRLLSALVAGITLAQAIPIQDRSMASSTSENAVAAAREEVQSQAASYFHEASFSARYDERFASKPLNQTAERDALKVLVQTYLATLNDLGVQTWLMHGSLLGWWWNKQMLPWDSNADVQVTKQGIKFLAAYYNMTTHYYKYSSIPNGRFFQLEVNPNYVHRDKEAVDEGNEADARWIDMDSGLFIDVTAEDRNVFLNPLLETTFEGVKAKIPYNYKEMLVSEYGEKALTNKDFKDHKFIDDKMEWVPQDEL
ncbi:hypothetical protein LZ31DRAFT_490625 [Colletotrichum somersetense]|nr:hypothetical protein LZ31DRAFT_490625 [Colletotrichum somersetense]